MDGFHAYVSESDCDSLTMCTAVEISVTHKCTDIRCYKKNMSVGTDPTYPAVKLVTTFFIAQHEVETTCT